jgi:histidine triad (HIT) family protein
VAFALPVKRLRETENLLAFHHPQSAYPLHILLVRRRAIPQLTDLEGDDLRFMSELVETVRAWSRRLVWRRPATA